MKVLDVCKNYFNGFQEVSDFRKNDNTRNVLAALKVLSYFTVVIPLGFAIAYGVASLHGRVSKKLNLSSHDKSVNNKAKATLLKKDSPIKDISPTTEPSNRQSTQLREHSYSEELNLESGITISKTEKLKEPDQQLIASMSPIEISGIATALIADVMDRLWIDIEVTNKPMGIVDMGPGNSQGSAYTRAKKYNKESPLMKFLLPVCTDIITQSFANPSDFLEKGIMFDFLNTSKTGLLDQAKDGALKKQIVSGMRSRSTLSMTLKVKAGKMLKLEIEQYLDGEWIARSTSTVKHLLEVAETGLL